MKIHPAYNDWWRLMVMVLVSFFFSIELPWSEMYFHLIYIKPKRFQITRLQNTSSNYHIPVYYYKKRWMDKHWFLWHFYFTDFMSPSTNIDTHFKNGPVKLKKAVFWFARKIFTSLTHLSAILRQNFYNSLYRLARVDTVLIFFQMHNSFFCWDCLTPILENKTSPQSP